MKFQHWSTEVAFVGPPPSSGPLPAVFYFSLSAEESLCLSPLNQPVVYLSQFPVRIFSLSLPYHAKGTSPQEALLKWVAHCAQGRSLLDDILAHTEQLISALLKEGLILEKQLAIAGLSRGAFFATHIAARLPLLSTLLGFAPLIHLHEAKEFRSLHDDALLRSCSLMHLTESLVHHHVRFYVGNVDTRVGTAHCFQFIEALSHAALKHTIRSPQAELILFPSIGKDGHGTPQDIFHQGAHWLAQRLGVTT